MAKPKPRTKRPPEILTREEARRLLRAPSGRAPTGIRNRALLTVLYRCGLRIAEALALHPKDVTDVSAEGPTVTVLLGKGRRRRTVPIDAGAFAVVERWLDRRQALGLNGRHRLFSTLRGRPLDSSYVRRLLPRLARRAAIEKRCHPHQLRHTYAAELAAEGVPIPVVSRLLGHASSAVTARYVDHISAADVADTIAARPPWSLENGNHDQGETP